MLLAVREDDGVDVEIALEPRQRLGAGAVVDLRLLVEDARDLDHRRARRLQLAVDVRQLLQRLEDELQERDRHDQRPDLERAVLVQVRAEIEHGAHRDDAEELDRREEDGEDLLHVGRLLAVRVVELVELGLEAALAVERLHDRHPRDRLRDLRRHRRDPVPLLDVRSVRDALEPARDDQRRRQDAERDQPEAPVDDQQRRNRGRQEDQVRDERRHPLRERVRDGVDVTRQPGDDPAGLLLREVAERESRQVVEEVAPQADHDRLPDPRQTADEDCLQNPSDRRDDDVDRDNDRQVVLVADQDAVVVDGDAVVDRVLDDAASRRSGRLRSPHRRGSSAPR